MPCKHGETSAASEPIKYQPKGGMCASCQGKLDDCSHLDFSKMPVLSTADGVKIVKCAEYRK